MAWWKGLIIGGRDSFSLGRVAFWLVFGLAVYFWLARPSADFPPTLETTLAFVLAYNFGSKAINRFGQAEKEDKDDA